MTNCSIGNTPENQTNNQTPQQEKVSILFLGDTHFGDNYMEKNNLNLLESKGYNYSFQNFHSFLNQADLVIANLETPITDLKESELAEEKDYIHWADPLKAPNALKEQNITVLSLANNHSIDFGMPGLNQTLFTLDQNRINYFGAGQNSSQAQKPYVKTFSELNNRSITVIGAFENRPNYHDFDFYADQSNGGVNLLEPTEISEQIKEIRTNDSETLIIVFPHWGHNYELKSPEQTDHAHQLIDAGADLIIGHGAHTIQQIEEYNDKWIIYSLGNFVFNSPGRYESTGAAPYSVIAQLDLTANEFSLKVYPIFTNNKVTNYQSRFVTERELREVKDILNIEEFQSSTDHEDRHFINIIRRSSN